MKKLSVWIFLILFLVFVPNLWAQTLPATCADLVTNIDVWGEAAAGVDLRDYTNSTLHWIGCPGNGCAPQTFFCAYDANTETLSFGTTEDNALRAVVDPGNARGNAMPTAGDNSGCCSSANTFSICNAPDANNNGVPIDAAVALCNALGYENGTLTWVDSNSCPEANATTSDGSDWTSDFIGSSGYGQTYTCTGFRERSTTAVPAIDEWGIIIFVALAGIASVYYLRRQRSS